MRRKNLAIKEIKVPNIGDVSNVEVIEVIVSPGEFVKKDDSLITLESEKASMEIPSPFEGEVREVTVKVGDKVSEGSLILTLDTQAAESSKKSEEKEEAVHRKEPVQRESKEEERVQPKEVVVTVPDIGDVKGVEVIEILVEPGASINKEDSLITLEGEKATMEIPSPYSGIVKKVMLKMGDKVSKGDNILSMEVSAPKEPTATKEEQVVAKHEAATKKQSEAPREREAVELDGQVHAGPSVRRIAREFGIDLHQIKGSGSKHRILKEDLQKYVKSALSQQGGPKDAVVVPKMPDIDFSKFGAIEIQPLNKIKRLTGINVHRSWTTIPHVTQFGEADITEMEAFRKAQKSQIEKEGIKLTPLVFIMKAVIAALQEFPHFNASLDSKGENLILKKYFNLGIAVDTPNGLVVPVVKNVDKKGMLALAKELGEISQKARQKGLSAADMSGSCFTISSLGGIGGTAFTPIINAPDVAILGVSKSKVTPVYTEGQFVPRLMLPLSLSYDHRVVDGADGARFLVYLADRLSDIRTLLL
jgi:pyruvate dehydrogenase E2 component (dihydrolipoamide acetyltransferase)